MEPSIGGPVTPPKPVHANRLSLQEASCSGETTEYRQKLRTGRETPMQQGESCSTHWEKAQTLLYTLRKKFSQQMESFFVTVMSHAI